MIKASVDGKPAPLVVDSGSFGTLLFADAAPKLGLFLRRIPNAKVYGVGGGADVYSARVRSFIVAGLELDNADLVVTGQQLDGAAGLLGAKFMMQADIEFDLPHDRIRFFKPVGCHGDQVVYWGSAYAVTPLIRSQGDQMLVRLAIDGESVQAQMDTGAPRSILTRGAAARLGGGAATHVIAPIRGLGGAAGPGSRVSFGSFSFGDETIRHPTFMTADLFGKDVETPFESRIAAPAVEGPQMLLGADFFRSHRIYVAISQHQVYATYVGGPVFAAPDLSPAGSRNPP